jgi:hypothetical protein
MSLREELQNRADKLDAELLALSGRIRAIERESDDVHTCINALDIAEMDAQDAALEPAPAEPEPSLFDDTNFDDEDDAPSEFISDLTGDLAIPAESGLHGEGDIETEDQLWTQEQLDKLSADAKAFTDSLGAPQIDPEPTELDAPASIVDDPELLAAVARAEATLQEAEPAYVGLQDAELDAEYEAMREREKADKPKLHFSIFGERGNRKLEEV